MVGGHGRVWLVEAEGRIFIVSGRSGEIFSPSFPSPTTHVADGKSRASRRYPSQVWPLLVISDL